MLVSIRKSTDQSAQMFVLETACNICGQKQGMSLPIPLPIVNLVNMLPGIASFVMSAFPVPGNFICDDCLPTVAGTLGREIKVVEPVTDMVAIPLALNAASK